MLLKRMLGGCTVLALVAPALFSVLPGASEPARPSASSGRDCCAVMPCCASGVQCATGSCENPGAALAATPAAAPENRPRLVADCSGPAPATPVADRDPMVPAARPASPAPQPRATVISFLAWSVSERTDDPTDPPPRV